MKGSYITALLLVSIVLFTGCIEGVSPDQVYVTYTSDLLHFSVQYPSNWVVNASNSITAFSAPLGGYMVIQGIPNMEQGLDSAADGLKLTYMSMAAAQEVSDVDTTLAGNPAREFMLTAMQTIQGIDVAIQITAIVTSDTDYFYSIAYVAPTLVYDSYLLAYEKAKETFTITE